MRKKKLLVIHHYGGLGGAGVSLINVLEMLRDAYEVVVFCPSSPPDMIVELTARGFNSRIPDVITPILPYYSGGPKLYQILFWYHVVNAIRLRNVWHQLILEERPDYVIFNSITLAWMVPLLATSRVRSICFVRETLPESRISPLKSTMRWLLNQCNAVFFLTDFDQQDYALQVPIQAVVRDCVKAVDFRVPLGTLRENTMSSDCLHLLFVGGVSPLKGFHILMEALLDLRDLPFHLVVAGPVTPYGSLSIQAFETVKQSGLHSKIEFTGTISEMPALYYACDVLVFPSISPHQARPVFEAGMAGVPVVISDFRQTQELVKDNVNGLVFTPGNPHDLAQKIRRLYYDPALRKRLGRDNREMALANHEFESVKTTLLTHIARLD